VRGRDGPSSTQALNRAATGTQPARGSVVASRISAGIAATTVVALPTMLVGGLAVLIQRDLGFREAELGSAIAASFVSGAIVAVPAGRIAERIGTRRTTLLGLAAAVLSLLGIALVARSWASLVACLALAGFGVTFVQLGVNVMVARAVRPDRQGLAFGAKQAAVPFASFLAGFSVPFAAATVGWQGAFILAALAVPFVAWRMPDAPNVARRAAGSAARGLPVGALSALMIGVALASAGGNSVPAFTVLSAVNRGVEPGTAGLVLAGGSLVGIVVRVAAGWFSDRLGRGSLLIVVGLLVAGCVGYVGLALARDLRAIAFFTALAFGGGWGWGGLIPLALARTNAGALGRAMGIVQVGPMTGAVVGPLVFGWLAQDVAFGAAWLAMALLALVGVGLILLSRRSLVASSRPR
jgi:MFS family permease